VCVCVCVYVQHWCVIETFYMFLIFISSGRRAEDETPLAESFLNDEGLAVFKIKAGVGVDSINFRVRHRDSYNSYF